MKDVDKYAGGLRRGVDMCVYSAKDNLRGFYDALLKADITLIGGSKAAAAQFLDLQFLHYDRTIALPEGITLFEAENWNFVHVPEKDHGIRILECKELTYDSPTVYRYIEKDKVYCSMLLKDSIKRHPVIEITEFTIYGGVMPVTYQLDVEVPVDTELDLPRHMIDLSLKNFCKMMEYVGLGYTLAPNMMIRTVPSLPDNKVVTQELDINCVWTTFIREDGVLGRLIKVLRHRLNGLMVGLEEPQILKEGVEIKRVGTVLMLCSPWGMLVVDRPHPK